MKKLFFILLIVVLVIAGGAYWFIKSGEYKPYIEQQIEQLTGRQVKIGGEVNLSFYPWLGLVANDVSISSTRDFAQADFAKIKHLRLKTRLLALLKHKAHADKVLFEGLRLNLLTDKSDRSNWSTGQEQTTTTALAPDWLKRLTFSEFRIVDAKIKYQNKSSNSSMAVNNLNLSLGKSESGKYVLKNLTGGLKVKDLGINIVSKQAITIDTRSETIVAKFLRVSGVGFATDLTATVNKAFSKPVVNGSILKLQANLRKTLAANSIKLDTANKKAMQSLSGTLDCSVVGDKLNLDNIKLKLDKTNIQGSAFINTKNTAVNFNLQADSINLDDYLSAATDDKNAPILPVKFLRGLNLNGKIKFSKNIVYSGLNLLKPSMSINAKNKVLKIKPINTGVFDGLYFGGGTISLKGKTPGYSFNENLKDINTKSLLEYLIGKDYVGGNIWLEGKGNASARVNLYGNTVNALIGSLSGKMDLSLNKGVIKGINLMEELTRAQMLAQKQIPHKSQAKKETRINKFSVNSRAKRGIIYSNKILALTNIFKVTGTGSANLLTEKLEYNLILEVLNTKAVKKTAVKDLIGYKIPLTLRGSFADPKINLDYKDILKVKARQELKKKEAEAKKNLLEKEKARLEEKLKDRFKDKLKDLF